ncbi:sterol regulatory element-binding protein 1-like isoform X1 [Diadema setosum]|uniref:sterol regulatory element-binding protein 1-like isoform X1 n=2 Tax=Diadema setosum TaxID=31175 RepID=UPI003B3A48ED
MYSLYYHFIDTCCLQITSSNVSAPATTQVAATPQVVAAPQVVTTSQMVGTAAPMRATTASEVIQQLVQKEQQKQLQNKTLAQLAVILQMQQQQQQQQQQQAQQQAQLLVPALQAAIQQQPQAQLQPQKPAQLQQQQQQQTTTVQQKVFPVTVPSSAMPSVQVIKQEQPKPVVTTVPQLVIQTSQNGSVAIVGSTGVTATGSATETTTTSSPMSKIPIAPLSSSPTSNGIQIVKKPEKRKAHNAIEQRYRRSINGRIEDLKVMLFKENKKVSKSHTLQKAIDHLVGLRKMVHTLKQENFNLKMELDKLKGTTTAVPDVKDPLTPPSSFTDSPDHSSQSCSDPDSPYPESLPSPKEMDMSPPSPAHTLGPTGLLDRTRLVLCVFMFSILAFNPFGFLINKGFESYVFGSSSSESGHSGGMNGGGRKLMDVGSEDASAFFFWQLIPTLLIWLVNGAVVATVLITMLYGDKTSKSLSIDGTAYFRFRTQADLEISRGNIAQALNQLFHCFGVLGRNHPLTSLEYYASFIWNLLCLPLNILFKGRGIGMRSSSSKRRDGNGKPPTSETLAKDIALTYHKILQLFLTGNFSLGVPRAFYMGLCSINHGERAREAMSHTKLAEIYATVGVLIRTRFPKSLQWLASPAFYRVRRLLTKGPSPAVLSWTLPAFSQHFKLDTTVPTSWQGPSFFTSVSEKRNPLVIVARHLREKMIHSILKGILTQSPEDGDDAQKKRKSSGKNHDFLMLLNCLNISLEEATNYHQPNIDMSSNLQARNDHDPLARWWINLLFVAAYWQIGEEEKAEDYFACVDSPPPELEHEGFPLAALQAYKARRALLAATPNRVPDECPRMLDLASDNLVRSMDSCHPGESQESIMLVQLLVVDWLLSTRSTIWQRRQGSSSTPSPKAELSTFQQDLNSLRKLASNFPHVSSKVTLYEAVARLMAGANPVRTQVLLDRNLRKRVTDPKQREREEAPTTERDRAQSLLVKSCYLYSAMPADQVERKNLLNDAVRSLEKVGDKRGMQSCQQMLQSLQKAGSPPTTNATVTTACC